jgi:methylase of polypeptide subunit release factors
MSKYIIKQNLEKGRFKKNKILELGSGTGLMSIVLANLGKKASFRLILSGNEVYATDTKESMRLLEENLEENQVNFSKVGSITSFVLDW